MWRLCRTGVKVTEMTIIISRGGGENQRIMLHDKTWFLTVTPPLKNGSRAPVMSVRMRMACVGHLSSGVRGTGRPLAAPAHCDRDDNRSSRRRQW